MVFEFAGAYLAGGEVTETIKSGIIDPMEFVAEPDVLVLGMMSALLSAGLWLLIASFMGWPVSTPTQLSERLLALHVSTVGPHAVEWGRIKGIVGSWFITPVIAGLIAYTIFTSTQKFIFDTESPLENAKKIWALLYGIDILYSDYRYHYQGVNSRRFCI